jgi:hypothetical protein
MMGKNDKKGIQKIGLRNYFPQEWNDFAHPWRLVF